MRSFSCTGLSRGRKISLVNDLSTLPEPQAWSGLRGIGMVETERHEGGRISRERRYYITTLVGNVRAFANAARAHWGIENRVVLLVCCIISHMIYCLNFRPLTEQNFIRGNS